FVLLVGECLRTRIDALALNAAEMSDIEAQLAGTVLVPSGRRILDPEASAKEGRHREVKSLPKAAAQGTVSKALLAESASKASVSDSISKAGSLKSS
ncbi:hypothetical protein AB4Y88_20335, partial [Paenarthrobacter sp. RAF9]